jgi:iron complex outermembrane receptor protein
MSDLNGNFTLKLPTDPDAESVTWVSFSSIGYQTRRFEMSALPEEVVLQERYYRGTDVLVRSERAEERQTPIAFTNFSRSEIERDYNVGEFPLLLQTTPNVFTYTDGGASLGYAYMSIRGFDDKRITTYINGVPLNDPEWQATYFVDLPDFTANIDDIQIQRGVGNSLYGDASFGGTVNIVTNTLSRGRRAALTLGYGEYTSMGKSVSDISRQSLEYSSGLIDGHWHFGGRFSNQNTDGFRDHSWYDGWSYYLSAARIDPNMTTELYLYGGPIKMHLAFWGAPRDAINIHRRYNPRSYENETDNFNQPHYHLHNTARLSEDMTLSNTFYYIHGDGHYEQLAEGSTYDDYGIPESVRAVDTSTGQPYQVGDLVRQDLVVKNQYGWNPRLDIDHKRGRHAIGGSVYYFKSDHQGRVTWAQHITGALDPQHQFYQWYGTAWVASLYGEEKYDINDKTSLLAALQLRHQTFDFDERQVGAFLGHQFDMKWTFVSPRLGLIQRLSERASLFGNIALSSRPPVVATIYAGDNPNVLPLLEIKDVKSDSTRFVFGDPLVDPERVIDLEIGGDYRTSRIAFKTTLFWMEFKDEIIPDGAINPNTGLRGAVNADRTVHAGIELDMSYRPADPVTLGANFSWNYNRIKKFTGTVDVWDATFWNIIGEQEVDYADKKVPGAPDYIGSVILDLRFSGWRITNWLSFAGRRYMELQNVESLSLAPYAVASVAVAYTFHDVLRLGNVILEGRIDNWADKKYESYGYGGDYGYDDGSGNVVVDGWAEYYVAPERWFYLQAKIETF